MLNWFNKKKKTPVTDALNTLFSSYYNNGMNVYEITLPKFIKNELCSEMGCFVGSNPDVNTIDLYESSYATVALKNGKCFSLKARKCV